MKLLVSFFSKYNIFPYHFLNQKNTIMRNFILLIVSSFVLAGFSACQKEYQCTQVITKNVNGIEIQQSNSIVYSDKDLTSACFNYEQMVNDTLTKSVTTCK